QQGADPHHRRQLRRALGHPAGAYQAGKGETDPARSDRRNRSRPLPRDELCAGAGSLHPHRGRAAHQQLPAVAARVHRALLHRDAVAGLRRRCARPRHRFLPQPRAALRPHQRAARSLQAGRGRLKGQLAARVGTAAVLIAALLAALFFLPPFALELVIALLLVAGGLEWARLCRLERRSAWALALAMAGVFFALGRSGLQPLAFVTAAAFWIVIAPLWMWRSVRPEQTTWIGAAGFAVLVPAGLAMLALEPLEL